MQKLTSSCLCSGLQDQNFFDASSSGPAGDTALLRLSLKKFLFGHPPLWVLIAIDRNPAKQSSSRLRSAPVALAFGRRGKLSRLPELPSKIRGSPSTNFPNRFPPFRNSIFNMASVFAMGAGAAVAAFLVNSLHLWILYCASF
jgi:hypothetical protein